MDIQWEKQRIHGVDQGCPFICTPWWPIKVLDPIFEAFGFELKPIVFSSQELFSLLKGLRWYHLGERVNTYQKGRLVSRMII